MRRYFPRGADTTLGRKSETHIQSGAVKARNAIIRYLLLSVRIASCNRRSAERVSSAKRLSDNVYLYKC